MKKKTKTLTILFSGIVLAISVFSSGVAIKNSLGVDETRAVSSTITVSGADFTTTDENQSKNYNSFVIGGFLKQYNSTKLWFTKGTGFIYNDTDLGNITKLTLSYNEGGSPAAVQRFNFSDSKMISYMSTGGTTINTSTGGTTYNETGGIGKGFFNISISSKNLQLTSLVIEFDPTPISSKTLEGISIEGTPSKTSYYAGESFDPSGITVSAEYENEPSVIIANENCSFTPNPLTVGTESVTVKYTEGEITVSSTIGGLTVSARTVTAINVNTNPNKMIYTLGESFDPTGMKITAIFDLGDDDNNYLGYIYSPTGPLNKAGAQLITLSDAVETSVSTTLTVQVNELPPITELFISEYVEGSSNNKYLEIFNGTGSIVDLSNYELRLFANGSSTAVGLNVLTLTGSLNNNSAVVYKKTTAILTLPLGVTAVETGSTDGVCNFNGDDAIGLWKKSSSAYVDIFGVIGTDPGSKWSGNGVDTVDMTLVRKPTVFSGVTTNPSTFDPSIEWDAYPIDTATYLGSHSVEMSLPQHAQDAIAYGQAFLDDTSAGCTAKNESQLSTAWGNLETLYSALSDDAQTYLKGLTPNELGNAAEHALARYVYIVGKYGLNNFIGVSVQSAPSMFDSNITDNVTNTTLTVMIGIIGVTVLFGYYYLNKKKEA